MRISGDRLRLFCCFLFGNSALYGIFERRLRVGRLLRLIIFGLIFFKRIDIKHPDVVASDDVRFLHIEESTHQITALQLILFIVSLCLCHDYLLGAAQFLFLRHPYIYIIV